VKEREEAGEGGERSAVVEMIINGVKEREEACEVCEVGIKEEIGVKVMVQAGLARVRTGLVGVPSKSWVSPSQVLGGFRTNPDKVLGGCWHGSSF
jgi:hypothetical protein